MLLTPRRSARPARRGLLLLCAVLLLGAPALSGLMPAQAAPGATSLVVQLDPATGSGGVNSPFVYHGTVTNQGPGGDGTEIVATPPSGATGVTVTCDAGASTAPCPTFANAGDGTWRATVAAWTANTVVAVRISGTFGVASSASTTLAATPAGGGSGDSSTQNTPLANAAKIDVAVTPSVGTVAVGDTYEQTVTYTNDGPAGVQVRQTAEVRWGGIRGTWTRSCAAAGGADCTASNANLPATEITANLWQLPPVTTMMPPGSAITYTYLITIDPTTCGAEPTLNGLGTGSYYDTSQNTTVSGVSSAGANFTVTGVQPCPRVDMGVIKTAAKPSVALGEENTYTVTFTNPSSVDLGEVVIWDQLSAFEGTTEVQARGTFEADSCTATGTACPLLYEGVQQQFNTTDWTRGYLFGHSTSTRVQFPAHSSMTVVYRVTVDRACSPNGGALTLNNTAARGAVTGATIPTPDRIIVPVDLTGVPACERADVTVQRTEDRTQVYAGESFTSTIRYSNAGPDPVSELTIQQRSRIPFETELDFECATQGSVPCPAFVDQAFWAGGSTMYEHVVAIGSGEHLEFTIRNTPVTGACPDTGYTEYDNNAAWFSGVPTVTGVRDSVTTMRILCNDVGSTTEVSPREPTARQPMTLTSVVENSAGIARDTALTISVPDGGFEPEAVTSTWCASTGAGVATCPTDLVWDAGTRTLSGTIPLLERDGRLTFTIPGRAGTEPPSVGTYAARTDAVTRGDINRSTHNSSFNFGLVNTRTTARATFDLGGPAPADLTFTGTMTCDTQGPFPFTHMLAAGQSRFDVAITSVLWQRDDCTVTLDAPQPPTGHRWEAWSGPRALNFPDVTSPVVAAFARQLTPIPTPVQPTPTTPPSTPPTAAPSTPAQPTPTTSATTPPTVAPGTPTTVQAPSAEPTPRSRPTRTPSPTRPTSRPTPRSTEHASPTRLPDTGSTISEANVAGGLLAVAAGLLVLAVGRRRLRG